MIGRTCIEVSCDIGKLQRAIRRTRVRMLRLDRAHGKLHKSMIEFKESLERLRDELSDDDYEAIE